MTGQRPTRQAFIAGLMVRLMVAAVFVRASFWFLVNWVTPLDIDGGPLYDYSKIPDAALAGVAVLYVLAFVGFRLERTIRNDLLEAASPNPGSDSTSISSPFAKRD